MTEPQRVIALPKRCQSHYAGLQCAFVLHHDHPHGNEDSGVYVTWGRMASPQQPTVGGGRCTCPEGERGTYCLCGASDA